MSENDDGADELGRIYTEVLTGVLERGFRLPMSFVAVGVNGAMVFGRWSVDEPGHVTLEGLTSHGETLVFPVNMMVVDATGEAARVVITGPGDTPTLH